MKKFKFFFGILTIGSAVIGLLTEWANDKLVSAEINERVQEAMAEEKKKERREEES